MDYGMMEGLLRDLKGYALSDPDREIIKIVEERFLKLDWDGIIETVRTAREDGGKDG